ncbi:hypothetical protein ACNKF0_01425 [Nocardioides sp. T5]|uniref:hypothetical protein n=1 Tax=Nocardioides sp. T5 TaxID=3400182 RepID=UPI003A87255B
MTTDLREELDALARTQTFSPDPYAWDRGRRARRRTRVAAGAAAVAVVAVVAGAGALVLQPDREARTATSEVVEGGAIPSRIDDIPADLEPTIDLAVGRGAAAFISTSQRVPVVVTAADGVAHLLDLPGWDEDGQALALSPDGLKLAWQQTGDGGATIGVLELTTGRQRSDEVHPDDLALRELTWSPDSQWLGWLGDADGGAHVGRLPVPGADLGLSTFVEGNVSSLAIGDAADVVLGAKGGLHRITVDQPELITRTTGVSPGLFSPDARFVALRSAPSAASSTLRLSDGAVLTHPFPDGTFDSGAVVPLGWLDDRHQLLQVWSAADEDAELVVTTPQVGPTSTWRRSVGSIDASIAGRVSLAVDLVPDLDGTSSQELTHDFDTADEPPAPFGIELSLFIGLGVAAAIAVLLALRWLWRRLLG